jgi:predicted DNA-binding ribbon-helix-helix protein
LRLRKTFCSLFALRHEQQHQQKQELVQKTTTKTTMNDTDNRIEQKRHQLETLQRENADRRMKLELLISRYQNGFHSVGNLSEAMRVDLTRQLPDPSESNNSKSTSPYNFLKEIVETYDELTQMKAILEQRIQYDRDQLQFYQSLLDRNNRLHTEISLQRKKVLEDKERSKSPTHSERLTNHLKDKHQQLCQDLTLVFELLKGTRHDRVGGGVTGNTNHQLWSLEKFTHELVHKYMHSPTDPYLMVSSIPVHPNHVELLKNCLILEMHEDNSDLVRVTDYLEGISEDS